MNQLRRHHISFRHAFEGISNAVTTQPNFKIHILFSLLAVWAGIYFRIAVYEWLFLSLTIFIGLGFELINTAIEHVVDLVTKDIVWKPNLPKIPPQVPCSSTPSEQSW